MSQTFSWSRVMVLALSLSALNWPGDHVESKSMDRWLDGAEKAPAGLRSKDWSSIRREYERHRHAALPTGGEYRARNAEQQWSARFDGRGFSLEPDSGAWSWGLQLESYGFAGTSRPSRAGRE